MKLEKRVEEPLPLRMVEPNEEWNNSSKVWWECSYNLDGDSTLRILFFVVGRITMEVVVII